MNTKRNTISIIEYFQNILKQNIDIIVCGVSSVGIEWFVKQISKNYKKKIPIVLLTKGLSIVANELSTLSDKIKYLLEKEGHSEINISAIKGPCLAAGLANKMRTGTVIANKNLKEDNNTKIRTYFGENNENFHLNKRHGTNQINTTKYNLFSFLPKSILFQFKKAANIYFLIVSILTSMEFSPKEPSSMIITFAFIFIFILSILFKPIIPVHFKFPSSCKYGGELCTTK